MNVAREIASIEYRMEQIAGDGSSPGGTRSRATHPHAKRFKVLVRDELGGAIASSAARAGVDPALVTAVASVESGFDPHATSKSGAAGIMQLMPQTARDLGVVDRYDALQSLRGGAMYLRELLDRFGGDLPAAIAAYNAGPSAVERFKGVPPYEETRAYVRRVLATYGR